MFAYLQEVTLVHKSKYRPHPSGDEDRVVYARGLGGERVFSFDGTPAPKIDTAPPVRYGVGYDSERLGRLVIVPDEWNESDAMIAVNSVFPDPARED